MVISAIVAPLDAQQIYLPPPEPPPAPKLDHVDQRIIEAMRAHGRYGAGVWELLNPLAEAQEHNSRAELRATRLALWTRLRGLLRNGLVFRQGRKGVSLTKLPQAGARRRRRKRAGSTVTSPPDPNAASDNKQLTTNLLGQYDALPTTWPPPRRTESATARPATQVVDRRPEDIREAATLLAKLPRGGKRPWSGYIGNQRIRRDQRIILADGRQVFAFGARRQQVVWSLHRGRLVGGFCGEPWEWGVVRAASVRLAKSEAAAILGGLKRGIEEVPSARKQAAARQNGRCPVRPGHRPRGRPRRP